MTSFTVDETSYDDVTLGKRFAEFARHPHLTQCRDRRYAVCLEDAGEWLSLLLYLRDSGASVAPLHPATPLAAARRVAREAGCDGLLFGHARAYEPVGSPMRCTEAGLILFSSGTSGKAKIVERSWASIDVELCNYLDALRPREPQATVIACSTTHAYGLISGFLASLKRGSTPTVLTNSHPKYVIRMATVSTRTLLLAGPTLLRMVVPMLRPSETLHAVMTSGAPLSDECFTRLCSCCEFLLQQYGCSEAGCISVNLHTSQPNELGLPLPHLSVGAGRSLQSPGEICVASDSLSVRTGDLGYFKDGRLFFLERLDDTINVAGVNVYPHEVESVVAAFEGVDEAVAFKRVDTWAGERVHVVFVAKQDVDPEKLRQWCAQRLSPFQMPLELQQVVEIPRTENGKISRRRLSAVGTADPTSVSVQEGA